MATILLAAPTTPDDRLAAICERSRGFVYGVSLLGVTGERSALPKHAEQMGRRCKAMTDRPVLLGVGISTPEQAAQAAAFGDGVIVGSASSAASSTAAAPTKPPPSSAPSESHSTRLSSGFPRRDGKARVPTRRAAAKRRLQRRDVNFAARQHP